MLGARVMDGVYRIDGGDAGFTIGAVTTAVGGGDWGGEMKRIEGGLDGGNSSADAYAESTSSSSPSSSSSYRQLSTIGRSANLTELPEPWWWPDCPA